MPGREGQAVRDSRTMQVYSGLRDASTSGPASAGENVPQPIRLLDSVSSCCAPVATRQLWTAYNNYDRHGG